MPDWVKGASLPKGAGFRQPGCPFCPWAWYGHGRGRSQDERQRSEPGPGLRAGRDESAMPNAVPQAEGTAARGNGEADGSGLPSAAPRQPAAGGNCRVDVYGARRGEFSTRPAKRGRARGHRQSRRWRQGALLSTFLSPQERWSPLPGQDPANPADRRQTENRTAKTLDPGLRRCDESCPNARAPKVQPAGWQAGSRPRQPAAGGNCRVDV